MLNRAQQLQDKARKCRELADTAMTEEGRAILREIAQRYESEASSTVVVREQVAMSDAAA